MRELIETSLALFRSRWRPILLVHLAYTGLGIIVFAPLLGALGSALLKLSGKPAAMGRSRAVNMALATPALVRSAHAAGKQLFVWTINGCVGYVADDVAGRRRNHYR